MKVSFCLIAMLTVTTWAQSPKLAFPAAKVDGANDSSTFVSFSPNGRYVVGGTKRISLWEADTGKLVTTFPHHLYHTDCSFSPDGRLIALAGRSVQILEIATGRKVHEIKGTYCVGIPRFCPNGKRVALFRSEEDRGLTGKIQIVDLSDLSKRPSILRFGEEDPNDIHILPDGNSLIAWNRNYLKRIDLETGNVVATVESRYDDLWNLKMVPTGGTLLAIARERVYHDDVIVQLDALSLEELKVIGAPKRSESGELIPGAVRLTGHNLAVSGDGNLTARSDHKTCHIFNVSSGELIEVLTGSSTNFEAMAFDTSARSLLTGGKGSSPVLWDIKKNAPPKLLATIALPAEINPLDSIYQIALTPDGSTVYFNTKKEMVEYSERNGFKPRVIFDRTTAIRGANNRFYNVYKPVLSPDGKLLAFTCERDAHQLCVYDRRAEQFCFVSTSREVSCDCTSLQFSADSKWLFAGSYHGTGSDAAWAKAVPKRHFFALDTSTWHVAGSWKIPEIADNLSQQCVLVDKRTLAIGLHLFDFEQRSLKKFSDERFYNATVSSDGRHVLAKGSYSLACLEIAKKKITKPIARYDNIRVNDYAISSANVIAIAGEGDNVRLFQLPAGEHLATVNNPADVTRVKISADGRTLVTLDTEKQLKFWRLGSTK